QAEPTKIFSIVGGLVAVKFIALIFVARVFRLSTDQSLLFSFAMAQGGEFGFVLFSFASQAGVLTAAQTAPLVAAVAVSMATTPLLLLVFERLIQPRVGTVEAPREFDAPEAGSVIIAGYGRFGQICSRLLRAEGIPPTVLEFDSDQVDLLRKFGRKVFYGDATRRDLLESAGAAKAKLLIITLDQPDKVLEMVHMAKKHFPQLIIIARARGRTDAYDLISAGVDKVYRETFDSALRAGTDAMQIMGARAHRAFRSAQRFRRHDERFMRDTAMQRQEAEDFFALITRNNQLLEQVLEADLKESTWDADAAWDTDVLKSLAGEPPEGEVSDARAEVVS
ncbi:MAG: NAD-binding protein, partial [Myxococcota bacterium]